MNHKEFETVKALPGPKRYEYFIKKIADSNEVWGLYGDQGWATMGDNDGQMFIPFFPKQEFAQDVATGEFENYVPKRIPLDDFLAKWMPRMKRDGMKPTIFYTDCDGGVILEMDTLVHDIERELENY